MPKVPTGAVLDTTTWCAHDFDELFDELLEHWQCKNSAQSTLSGIPQLTGC
jgi:hypothetical protein